MLAHEQKCLFLINVDPSFTHSEFEEHLNERLGCVEIKHLKIFRDWDYESKGYALALFNDYMQATLAINKLQGEAYVWSPHLAEYAEKQYHKLNPKTTTSEVADMAMIREKLQE